MRRGRNYLNGAKRREESAPIVRRIKMSNEKTVNTIAGPFNRTRLGLLQETIKDHEKDDVVMFEGNELLVSFGRYLAEFVEGELGKRGHNGL